jgi:predicted aconitase
VNLKIDERSMLRGDRGEAPQRAMELLVRIGESSRAEEMVDVTSAHLLTVMGIGDAIFALTAALMHDAKAVVRTTTHALPFDVARLDDMRLPAPVAEDARAAAGPICDMYSRFGALPTYTCMPYSYYDFRMGEHLAFTDSQVVPLVNSWFGAMTNMETPASAIASAITGKTPKYGMHLWENRFGDALIEVKPDLEAERFDRADYAALAFWAGRILVDGLPIIPVYAGLSPGMTIGEAKNMCLAHTWSSDSTIFHILGVTPEARSFDSAFGRKKPKATYYFGKNELADAYEGLSSAETRSVDVVCLGCPHCTIEELQEIAQLLQGQRVHCETQLWIGVGRVVLELATRMGVAQIIEKAGGLLISDACATFNPAIALGARVVATNAGAFYTLPVITQGKASVWFGRTTDCIHAAVVGRWEA